MPKKPPKPPFDIPELNEAVPDPLAREAFHWLLHLHSGRERPEDWTAFEEWRESTPEHKRAGARAQRIWDQIGASLLKTYRSRLPKLPVVIAAALGLSALTFLSGLFGPPASFFADYRSSTGEVKSVVLKDGSEITLDTGTTFDVADGDRTVKLHTGQIFVSVKPGHARPFTVIAGNAQTQAIGTAFAVRRDRAQSSIVVTESAVNVSDIGTRKSVRVDAGSAITLDRTDGLEAPRAVDVAALTAWRHGELKFVDRPLRDVVAELERYRWGKIVILGSGIGDLPVRATVDLRRTDEFVTSLQIALPVSVTRWPGLVMIQRARSR
jgi:transmembrane sensor